MSNKDDDFRDFMDDDEESGGDDFGDFDFGDDDSNVDIDDNGDPFNLGDDIDSGDGGDDGFDEPSEPGSNRTFVFAAIGLVIVLLLCGGLILLQVQNDILGLNRPVTETVAAIETTNAFVAQVLVETQTAGTQFFIETQEAATEFFIASQTAEVANANATATAVVANQNATATAVAVQATQTADFIASQTAQADANNQTATAIALGGGASPTPEVVESVEPVATTPAGVPVGGLEAIQQTATALAEFRLNQQTATATLPAIGGPTVDPGSGGGGDTELPDTGLFDDLGSSPISLIFVGLALVAVIFLSRALRVANSNSK